MHGTIRLLATTAAFLPPDTTEAADTFKVATFTVDATPPIGSPLAYDPMLRKGTSLWLKGIVLLWQDEPIVLVAVDWIGIGGEGNTRFRETIALPMR